MSESGNMSRDADDIRENEEKSKRQNINVLMSFEQHLFSSPYFH